MKKISLVGALMLWPMFALGQSSLYFPRTFTQQDRLSTGFAIVNPGSSDAAVTFTLYGTTGSTVATASRTVPHGGQFAQLGSELFPSATAAGWVQVDSATTGLQGLWVGGDFVNLTRADGAISAPLATDQVFPYVPTLTELSIANPSTSTLTLTLKGFDDAGAGVGTVTQMVTAHAILQIDPRTIVQSGTLAYIRIIGVNGAFCSLIVLRGTVSLDNAVQNGIDVSLAPPTANTLVFPHFIEGPLGTANYNTIIAVANLSNNTITVHLQYTPDLQFASETGGTPLESQDYTVGPQGTVRGMGSDFFQYPQFGFHDGYVRVTANGPIAGAIDYGTAGVGGEAVVPAQLTPQTNRLFVHIADLSPWQTGIAFQNPSNSAANVEVYAMNPNGTLIGGAANVATARFTLAAGAKTAKLLSELIPQTQARTSDGGFVFVRTTNAVPIHAIQLFFTRDLKILANVSGVTLPAGINYTPPNP